MKTIKNTHLLDIGLFQKKTNNGRLMIWNFKGYQRNRMQNLQGWVTKKKLCGIYRVLVIGIGISKGCNTVLHNFQVWSFDLSGISRCKVNKRKLGGRFSKRYFLDPLFCFFFWNSPLDLKFSRYFL